MVPLVGCSNLLGIQDPSTGSGSGTDSGTGSDASVDAPPSGTYLRFSAGSDIKLATRQRARLHVVLMHNADVVRDVSADAGLTITGANAIASGAVAQGLVSVDGLSAGAVTLLAHYSGADDGMLNVAVAAAPCTPVVNEFQTGSGADPAIEFIEIYDPCTDATFVVDGWKLGYRAFDNVGAADSSTLTALTGSMTFGQFRVYGSMAYAGPVELGSTRWGSALQQMSAGIALEDMAGTPKSKVAYGKVSASHPFIDGNPAPMMINDKFGARGPFEGNDSGDASKDFTLVGTATPGAANNP